MCHMHTYTLTMNTLEMHASCTYGFAYENLTLSALQNKNENVHTVGVELTKLSSWYPNCTIF